MRARAKNAGDFSVSGINCLLNRNRYSLFSAHFKISHLVHVTVVKIFSTHAPDEHIVACAGRSMNTPFGSHNSLLVVEPDKTVLLRLAHKMAYGITFRHIEVKIHLDTAVVGMCRHSVPHAAWLQFGQSHLQLAWTLFKHIRHDELIDYSVVALLHLADGKRVGLD